MTRQEMLDSARQTHLFPQGSMVIPLNHVEKFLAAQREDLKKSMNVLEAHIELLEMLTK